MNAWRVRRPGPMSTEPLERVSAPVPRPEPSELLVAVRACGVCRTDLHVTEGDLPVHRDHVTPGHEVVGEVVEVGADAGDEFSVGDRVGIAWLRHTCGECTYCRRGDENLCPKSRYTGWDADGGYAEFATVPAAFAHHLPSGYSDTELGAVAVRRHHRLPLAATRGAASRRSAGAVRVRRQRAHHRAGRAGPGRRGACDDARRGSPGVGARAGCRVSARSRPTRRRYVWTPRSCSRPSVIWCYPRLEALDRGGTLAIAGIHLSDIPVLNYQRHLFQERQVRSVTSNTRADARAFLDFVAEHHISVTTPEYPLSHADRALSDLSAGPHLRRGRPAA